MKKVLLALTTTISLVSCDVEAPLRAAEPDPTQRKIAALTRIIQNQQGQIAQLTQATILCGVDQQALQAQVSPATPAKK